MLQDRKLTGRLPSLALLVASVLLLCAARAGAQNQVGLFSFEHQTYRVATDRPTGLVYAPVGAGFDARLAVLDLRSPAPPYDYYLYYIALPTDSFPFDVAVDPNTRRAFLTDQHHNRLLMVDTIMSTYLGSAALGGPTREVAVNPSTKRVYVTLPGDDKVQVVDGETGALLRTVSMPQGCGQPWGLAVDSRASRVYVTSPAGNNVCVIGGEADEVVAIIPAGFRPFGIAADEVSGRVYVANESEGTITVIETAGGTVEATIRVGYWMQGVAVNPETSRVYVTDSIFQRLHVIDGDPLSATHNTVVGWGWGTTTMGDIAVAPSKNFIYVANAGSLFIYHDPPPSPAAQLAALIEKVKGLNLSQGITNSLDAKLENALAALDSARGGDGAAACRRLEAFVGEVRVQADRQQLTSAQADNLVRSAERVRIALGCG